MSSPKITDHSWGSVSVDGVGDFKDVKLFPGGARPWDWNETGTRHRPGVQVADAEELVAKGARVVVLSRGVQGVLQVPEATVQWLEEQGVTVHVLLTDDAVAKYNELAASQPVGALIHSTC